MKRRICIVICIAIFLGSIISLFMIYASPKSNAELYDIEVETTTIVNPTTTREVNETTNSSQQIPTETIPVENNVLNAWKQVNDNVSGVITVANLKAEPVVTTENQNEYLYLDIKGNYNQNGTLFTAADSKFGESKLTCIFGHNMNNGAMFGSLKSYKNIDYLKEHPSFEITTDEGTSKCKIVGVMFASADYSLNDWYYPQAELTEEEFENFRFQVRSRSLYIIEDKFDYSSNYIMLSTCDYGSSNERFVVVARICDNNTNYNVQNNPLVLYTKEYYKENGFSEPSKNALKENYMTYYTMS